MTRFSTDTWAAALLSTLYLLVVSFTGTLAAVMVARYLGWVG